MKIFLGDKFYSYNEDLDKVNIIRIVKIKNENSFSFLDENGTKKTITKEVIIREYTRLKPDATLSFNIVNLENNMKDIIVALYRTSDLTDGNMLPQCICRQNIVDFFSNQIQKNEERMYIGVSVSKETIPEDVDYEMVLACNGIHYTNNVSVYLDDKLDTILSMVNVPKYDTVLKLLHDHVNNTNKFMGYTSSLKQLLKENDFMYDFQKAFNIYRVPFDTIIIEDELEVGQRRLVEDILKVEMFKTYVIPYDREVDLKKIERDYVLISDTSKNVFILAYDKGEYLNKAYADNIKDKRDAIALLRYKKINK